MNHYKQLAERIGLPGLVTIVSVLFSWLAIGYLLSGNVKMAIVFSCIAFQLDVLDGFLARKMNRASEFGRQLDSLSDLINYSLMSALVTMLYLLPNVYGVVVGALILIFGIIRLASFNVFGFIEKDGVLYYQGIITCIMSLSTLIFFYTERFIPIYALDWYEWGVIGTLSVLAILQVSKVKVQKSGVLFFWIPLSFFILIGSLLWL